MPEQPVILWVNCARLQGPPELVSELRRHCTVDWLSGPSEIRPSIEAAQPHILCFDYDYPSAYELALLRETKASSPSIAILMLTKYHSESLAVWALRTRVWDYLVKPVSQAMIRSRITALFELDQNGAVGTARCPSQIKAAELTASLAPGTSRPCQKQLLRASAYVDHHLSNEIDAQAVARFCCMSYHHFSRSFKLLYGKTFSNFLHERRVNKAASLLRNPGITITQAGYEAGFRDMSYFSRIFGRYMGVTPSEYRKVHKDLSSLENVVPEVTPLIPSRR